MFTLHTSDSVFNSPGLPDELSPAFIAENNERIDAQNAADAENDFMADWATEMNRRDREIAELTARADAELFAMRADFVELARLRKITSDNIAAILSVA